MHLAMPMNKGIPIILYPGTKFFGRTIMDGLVWQFTSTYIDKQPKPVPIWITELPFDLKKIQLRSYVRIPAMLQVSLAPTTEENGEAEEQPAVAAKTIDISGGGMKIAVRESYTVGAQLNLTFELPDTGKQTLLSEVVRADKQPEANIFWLAVKFVEIPEREREKIIKFIFKKQCERRQKGF